MCCPADDTGVRVEPTPTPAAAALPTDCGRSHILRGKVVGGAEAPKGVASVSLVFFSIKNYYRDGSGSLIEDKGRRRYRNRSLKSSKVYVNISIDFI